MTGPGRPKSGRHRAACALLAGLWASACAAQVSDIQGLYSGSARPARSQPPVRMEFTVVHLAQRHGLDAVPKHTVPLVPAFEEIFRDAVTEIQQLSSYTLVTEAAPRSGAEVVIRPDHRTEADYSVRMVCLSQSSFAADTLWALVALGSMILAPAPFSSTYSIDTTLRDHDGRLVASYRRAARITSWVEAFLIFAYPFRPPEGQKEALLSMLLRDQFREINAEGVLTAE